MTRDAAERLVLALRAAFPRPAWDEATVVLYVGKIAKLDDEQAGNIAIDGLIDSATFRPSFAEVRREYLAALRTQTDERARTHGLPEPEVTEKERRANLKRLREMTEKIGREL